MGEATGQMLPTDRRFGLSDALGEARIFHTIHEAVEALRR